MFEQRSAVESLTSWLLEYRISGPVFLTIESSAAGIANQDPVTREYIEQPAIGGEAVGIELATPAGPVRVAYGHNTIGRKQATFTIGTRQ